MKITNAEFCGNVDYFFEFFFIKLSLVWILLSEKTLMKNCNRILQDIQYITSLSTVNEYAAIRINY